MTDILENVTLASPAIPRRPGPRPRPASVHVPMAPVVAVVPPPYGPISTPSTAIHALHIHVIPTITPVVPAISFVAAIPVASRWRPGSTAPSVFTALTVVSIIARAIHIRIIPPNGVVPTGRGWGVAGVQSADLVPPTAKSAVIVSTAIVESSIIKASTSSSSAASPSSPPTTVASVFILAHPDTQPQFGTLHILVSIIAIITVISIPPTPPTPAAPATTVSTSERRAWRTTKPGTPGPIERRARATSMIIESASPLVIISKV